MRTFQLGSLLLVCALSACGGRSSLNDYQNGVGIPTPGDELDAGVPGDQDGADDEDGGTITIPGDGSDGQPGDGSPADGSSGDGSSGDGSSGDGSPSDGSSGDGSPGEGAVGSACEESTECGNDGNCVTMLGAGGFSIELPGGYCTLGCDDSSDCPDGSACLDAGVMFGIPASCIATCEGMDDCRDGYSCGSLPIGGDATQYCLPPFGGP